MVSEPAWYYSFCGLCVAVDRPIEELLPCAAARADISVSWNTDTFPSCEETWFRDWRIGEQVILRFARARDGYLLRFTRGADFWVSSDGARVYCRQQRGTPDAMVRHLLLDQTLPMVLSRRGWAVFHASAVDTGAGAIAFAGPSGRGKSTLAGYLSQHGCVLLSDDCLALSMSGGELSVQPAYPGVRLWQDSLQRLAPGAQNLPPVSFNNNKRRFGCGKTAQFPNNPVPLRRFYFLNASNGGDIKIEPLTGAALVRELVRFQFLLDTEDAWELNSGFQIATQLAHSGFCYCLTVPRDLKRLDECASIIAAHASTDPPPNRAALSFVS